MLSPPLAFGLEGLLFLTQPSSHAHLEVRVVLCKETKGLGKLEGKRKKIKKKNKQLYGGENCGTVARISLLS